MSFKSRASFKSLNHVIHVLLGERWKNYFCSLSCVFSDQNEIVEDLNHSRESGRTA